MVKSASVRYDFSMDPLALHHSAEDIASQTTPIHAAILRSSPNIKTPNFTAISTPDVRLLFDLYDQLFFGGWCAQTVMEKTGNPLGFRVSSTMTRAGGKTLHYTRKEPDGSRRHRYEIAIASRLLFNTFGAVERPVDVCGMLCRDRLEALQRIMEHEIIHLIELLNWGQSSCNAQQFKSMAQRIFGHGGTTHDLVTTREVAAKQHDITPGKTVAFEFEGQKHIGVVNRIHNRATVLVESAEGMPYSNGKKYQKFYIPLGMLSVV